jgi:hypothetical protein
VLGPVRRRTLDRLGSPNLGYPIRRLHRYELHECIECTNEDECLKFEFPTLRLLSFLSFSHGLIHADWAHLFGALSIVVQGSWVEFERTISGPWPWLCSVDPWLGTLQPCGSVSRCVSRFLSRTRLGDGRSSSEHLDRLHPDHNLSESQLIQ